jgi:hypothetical protein
MKTKSNKHKTDRSNFNQDLASRLKHKWSEGEILAKLAIWDTYGSVDFATVKAALKRNSLKDELCNGHSSRVAFSRAVAKLAQDGLLSKPISETGDILKVRLLKWVRDETSTEAGDWTTEKRAIVLLNTVTGIVQSKDKEVEAHVQKLVNAATDLKTVSDISGLVKRLFEDQIGEHLIAAKKTGGVYLVLQPQFEYLDKIADFLRDIGWLLDPWPIPAGSDTQKMVARLVTEDNKKALEEYKQKIEEINFHSRDADMQRRLEGIKTLRMQIQGRAAFCQDEVAAQLEELDKLDQIAIEKVKSTSEEKAKKKEEEKDDEGATKKDALGCQGKLTKLMNAQILEQAKTVEEALEGIPPNERPSKSRIEQHYRYWVDESAKPDWDKEYRMARSGEKYIIEKIPQKKKKEK